MAGMQRDARVLAGVTGLAGLAVLLVVVQAALSGPAGTALSSPAGKAPSGPGGAPASATSVAAARARPPASAAAPSPVPAAQAPARSPSPARPAAASPSRGTAAHLEPAPRQVVRAFYAAISRHDWPQVWRLGGRNLGYGPYATYRGMIAGYAGTIRDQLTDLRVRGSAVTGHFLAYHVGGQVRAYRFGYVVRDGAIVSGFQQDITGG
jgi:hypothetical protein